MNQIGASLTRVILAILSYVVGVVAFCAALALFSSCRHFFLWHHWSDLNPFPLLLAFVFVGLYLGLPGLLVAVPLVLLLRRTRGWNYWAVLALGILFGPLTLAYEAMWGPFGSPQHGFHPLRFDDIWILLFGAIPSGLSTLLYLRLRCRSEDRQSAT